MPAISIGFDTFAHMLMALAVLISLPIGFVYVVSVMCRDIKEEPFVSPDQKRIVEEFEELSARLDRLYAQFETKDFAKKDGLEKDLMQRQAAYMHAYQLTLMERIGNFNTEGNA